MGLFSKPEVVIAKESSNAKEYLRQLEELAEKATGENAKKIAKEIAVVKAGIIGEDNILFELKNSGMDMVVLHDLYIESVSGVSAQIDFLVLTPKINFVLECKNLFGNIEINSKGDFIRTIRCGGRYYKEGIYSPITQNQRHLQVLNECRNENHGKVMAALRNHWFSNFFKGLIVLSNPKTIINDQDAPQEVKKQVVRADQLVETIKRMNRESSELKSSMKDLKEDGEYYLNKMHIEKPITYIEKFKQEELEDQPAAEPPALIEPAKPELPEKNRCPKCGKPLVMREARRGAHVGEKFWGMTCIKVMPLYGYLEHKRLALLDLNPAVRDNRLILRVNFGFHAPRDAASGGQSARDRHQPTGNAILFAERLHLHGGIGGVEGEHLIRLFLSHHA